MTIQEELLRAFMAHLAARDGVVLMDEVIRSWLKIVRKFAPLIGATSVLLVFERSLENNLSTFRWLPAPVTVMVAQPETAVERLRTSTTGHGPDEILAAHRAILRTFIYLMTALIGARLTVQFMRAALPEGDAAMTTEEHSG